MLPILKITVMHRQFIACLMLVLLWLQGVPCTAQEAAVSEADIKAAFLYNFTKFVEWPPEVFSKENSSLTVGVFGDEEFTATLKTLLQDKKAQAHGHPFVVRKVSTLQEAKTCQVLFFRETENRRFAQLYDSIKKLPILTVGEGSEFLDAGGMFNLFFEDKQPRFEVNPAPAENAGLSISSKVLRLAKKVRKGGAK